MARWGEIFSGVTGVSANTEEYAQFLGFMEADRSEVLAALTDMAVQQPLDVLESFEWEFLARSSELVEPLMIVRALELYAWFKMAQTARCGSFQGFCTRDGKTHQFRR